MSDEKSWEDIRDSELDEETREILDDPKLMAALKRGEEDYRRGRVVSGEEMREIMNDPETMKDLKEGEEDIRRGRTIPGEDLRKDELIDMLLDVIQDMVYQHCWVERDGVLDSMALSTSADAMRLLAAHGRIKLVSDSGGRRVIGKSVKRDEAKEEVDE